MLWKDVSSILLIKRKDLMGFWLKKKKKYVWNILTKIFERSKHLCTKNIYVDCIGLTSPMSSILGLQNKWKAAYTYKSVTTLILNHFSFAYI